MKPNRKWDPLRPVRVRRDPPTLEEAVIAAQGLSADIEQQVEIASGLMGIPREEVRPVIASAPAPETARGFERSSRAMPQVVVLRRRTTPPLGIFDDRASAQARTSARTSPGIISGSLSMRTQRHR